MIWFHFYARSLKIKASKQKNVEIYLTHLQCFNTLNQNIYELAKLGIMPMKNIKGC